MSISNYFIYTNVMYSNLVLSFQGVDDVAEGTSDGSALFGEGERENGGEDALDAVLQAAVLAQESKKEVNSEVLVNDGNGEAWWPLSDLPWTLTCFTHNDLDILYEYLLKWRALAITVYLRLWYFLFAVDTTAETRSDGWKLHQAYYTSELS